MGTRGQVEREESRNITRGLVRTPGNFIHLLFPQFSQNRLNSASCSVRQPQGRVRSHWIAGSVNLQTPHARPG
jgi:hypothetical protein